MITVLIILLLCYLGLIFYIWAFQDRFLFFPTRLSSQQKEEIQNNFPNSEITIKTSEGISLQGWFIKGKNPQTDPLVIYFGGNAEEVSKNLPEAARLEKCSFLYMNYRGYGNSEGRPSEKTLLKDALEIFDYITIQPEVDKNNVYIMGRSLGSGVAVYLASQRKVKGLILVTPFDSALNLAKHYYPYMPVSLILKHPFNSLSLLPNIHVPLLAILAEKDAVVPLKNSLNLIKHYQGPQTRITIKDADHHDVESFPEYWEEIHQFLARTH